MDIVAELVAVAVAKAKGAAESTTAEIEPSHDSDGTMPSFAAVSTKTKERPSSSTTALASLLHCIAAPRALSSAQLRSLATIASAAKLVPAKPRGSRRRSSGESGSAHSATPPPLLPPPLVPLVPLGEAGAVLPVGHDAHTPEQAAVVRPACAPYVPAGHSVHATAPANE
jgi:hypothetical protein